MSAIFSPSGTKKELWKTGQPFFQILSIKSVFPGRTRNPSYLLSQTEFRPTATTTCLQLLKQSSDAKEKVRSNCVLFMLQLVHSRVFQLNCCFRVKPAIHGISFHRPNFALPLLPPACIYWNQGGMHKYGKKASHFLHREVHSLTIFSFNLLFSGWMRKPSYLLLQTKICPTATATHLRLLKPSSNSKRMVKSHGKFIILQLSC